MRAFLLLYCFISVSFSDNSYDFIVIGSATGGVVASRLAEKGNDVLLIEAGPDDLTYSCKYAVDTCVTKPFGDLIAGIPVISDKSWWFLHGIRAFQWNDAISMAAAWNYDKTLLNFSYDLIRPKMLGGGLSHNGQSWTRGSVRDFDYIAKKYNLPDWSFKNVLPFYQKLENYLGKNRTLRGNDGPIDLRTRYIQKYQYKLHAFINAAINSGLSWNNHQNGDYPQSGIGFGQGNIGKYKNGKFGLFNTTYYKASSSTSYIRNIGIKSGYLTVWYNTTVQRILFDDDLNAIGIEYYDANNNNNLSSIYCNHEVILSAGFYQSPQLLMLSGIGPIEELNKFNIKPIYINNKIGKFGQEHPYFIYKPLINISYLNEKNISTKGPNKLFKKIRGKYVKFGIEGRLQLYISSGNYDRLGFDYNDIRVQIYDSGYGDRLVLHFEVSTYSKNLTIKLKSLDSRIFPNVYPNLYSDSRDYNQMINAILAIRKILFHTKENKGIFIDDHPIKEFNNVTIKNWRDWIWKNGEIEEHGVGTIPMGSDYIYPVDTKCNLKGVNNLRIVDTSIWPECTNSGTMSLAFMIGEKCTKHIIDHHLNHNINHNVNHNVNHNINDNINDNVNDNVNDNINDNVIHDINDKTIIIVNIIALFVVGMICIIINRYYYPFFKCPKPVSRSM